MKIGILRSTADISHGGIFQYEKAFLDALSEIASSFQDEFVYLSYARNDLPTLSQIGGLNYRGLPIEFLNRPIETQKSADTYIQETVPPASKVDPDHIYFDREGAESFRNAGIDLVLQLSPVFNTFSLRLPFIIPIFDLNHRLQPEFPEVSEGGEFELREYFYINICRFATMVLVDSEVGKADVLRFYGDYISEDRISVVPYYPPIVRKPPPSTETRERVKTKYGLPDRYFFYPAQFWQHKNHSLIVKALRIIAQDTGTAPALVLCGAYSDHHRAKNFQELMALVKDFGLENAVSYVGAAPEEDMPALYALSTALVMPTFFGPTNIPPFEAWHYGRPVISSDIPGICEQIGDAGLLVNPRSPEDLAQAMSQLWNNADLAATLVAAGRRRFETYSWASYIEGVKAAIAQASRLVHAGQTPPYPDILPAQ